MLERGSDCWRMGSGVKWTLEGLAPGPGQGLVPTAEVSWEGMAKGLVSWGGGSRALQAISLTGFLAENGEWPDECPHICPLQVRSL